MIARPTSGEVANPAAASASISVDLPEPGPPVTTWSESVLIARPRDSAAPYPLFQRLQRLHQAPLDSGGSQVRYRRSEEHTSELQSLMRNSYAVFCLKKKNNKHTTQ